MNGEFEQNDEIGELIVAILFRYIQPFYDVKRTIPYKLINAALDAVPR